MQACMGNVGLLWQKLMQPISRHQYKCPAKTTMTTADQTQSMQHHTESRQNPSPFLSTFISLLQTQHFSTHIGSSTLYRGCCVLNFLANSSSTMFCPISPNTKSKGTWENYLKQQKIPLKTLFLLVKWKCKSEIQYSKHIFFKFV